jgi:DNA-binding NarL/FixJ family response regulator
MRKQILVVDDSAPVRGLIRSFLESKSGIEVCGEAADGVEGVEKALELKPDLIVLDLSMPRMNGLETAAALQKTMPKVPIVLFTLHKDVVSSHQARNAGIASVISKTDQMASLYEEVRRLVGAV